MIKRLLSPCVLAEDEVQPRLAESNCWLRTCGFREALQRFAGGGVLALRKERIGQVASQMDVRGVGSQV